MFGHMPSCYSSSPCAETPPRKLLLCSQHFCLDEPFQRCDRKLVATVRGEEKLGQAPQSGADPSFDRHSLARTESPSIVSCSSFTRASKWRKCSVSRPLQCGMASLSTKRSLATPPYHTCRRTWPAPRPVCRTTQRRCANRQRACG